MCPAIGLSVLYNGFFSKEFSFLRQRRDFLQVNKYNWTLFFRDNHAKLQL